MKMKLLVTVMAILMFASATPLQAQPNSAAVEVHVLRSRKAVARKLGPHIADQIPGYFDFKNYALVWVPHPLAKKPKVQLHEVAKTPSFQFSISLIFAFALTKRSLTVTLLPGATCSGGMAKNPTMMQACVERARVSAAHGAKTLNLFAVDRRRAKRVRGTRPTLPRP